MSQAKSSVYTQSIEDMFGVLSDDPQNRLADILLMQKMFRMKAGEALQPALDAMLRNPPENFGDKQVLASRVNAALHDLGLAICQSGSAEPCSVVATRSQSVENGWLRLQQRKGKRLQSAPIDKLESLELVESLREESLAKMR